MKYRKRYLAAALLIPAMMLAGCSSSSGIAGRKDSTAPAENGTDQNAGDQAGTGGTEPSRPDIFTWQEPWQQSLAQVIKEKQEKYGKPSFVMDFIRRVGGMGIVHAYDLDGDGQEELMFVIPEPNDSGYYDYKMEIWKGKTGSAECLFSGICYRMGVDNMGIQLWEGEDGTVYFLYDDKDSMNGRYLGRIDNGQFRQAAELDWREVSYDSGTERYIYDGKDYRPFDTYVINCYNQDENSEEFRNWKDKIRQTYRDALAAVGLTKEDGAKVFTPGLSAALDDKYVLVKATYVDAEGMIKGVWEYDYDNAGNEVRSYYNDILRSEKRYSSENILVYEADYRTTGLKNEETFYNDSGDILEKITYNDDGRTENWHYEYTYDEKGRLQTAYMGIGGIKEYYYNDDDVMIEGRTVNEQTGEVINTHEFILDDQGRHVEEYLNSDGRHLKFQTWEYNSDGTRTETLWDYRHYDENVEWVYLEGNEKPGTVTVYDAQDNVLSITVYAFRDYGTTDQVVYTTEENTYDSDGNRLTSVKISRTNGEPCYEERAESEYTADGKLKRRVMTYHNYGYWTNLGETEKEISFTDYESEFNELGYRVHGYTWKNDDPYATGETYLNSEIFLLYENAYGDQTGMDY
ncbi:MAG: hypothetical protein K6G61_11700 [Solobacterium sp.]|nr:hypothetical protein [Solobacterium sp.]